MSLSDLSINQPDPENEEPKNECSIPSWLFRQNKIEPEIDYSIPYWFGRYHDSFETYPVGSYKDEEHYYACIDHNNFSSGNDPDGHIRFRPLPYPIPKGIDLEYARPRKRGSNSTCMVFFVKAILHYWKVILLCALGFVILFLLIFITIFLVFILPKHAEGPTISTGVPNFNFSTRLATTKSLIIFTTKNQSETTTIAAEVSPNPPANFNIICTNGFQLVNGKCWKFISQHQSKNNSDLECQKYSGSGLATIQTAQDNLELQNFLKNQNVGRVWIGLECFGNEEEKCEWDNQQGPLTEYSNFLQGFPNWFIGNCTYFDSATGKWISADCDVYEMAYVCELPTTIEDTCEYNYADHCYLRNDAWISFQAALDTCHQQCSEMVSVHSELENRFIQSMYLDVTDQSILWLGGLAAKQDYIMWTDNSPNDYQSDYSAFNNSASCLTMSYQSGMWFTSPCSFYRWFICKRKIGVSC